MGKYRKHRNGHAAVPKGLFLLCVSGRSGAGKDTFVSLLVSVYPQFVPVKMCTTRPRRTPDEDCYVFLTDGEFAEEEKNSGFAEVRQYQSAEGIWKYGTRKNDIADIFAHGKYPVIASCVPSAFPEYRRAAAAAGYCTAVCFLDPPRAELLARAAGREKKRKDPHPEEVCRRFLADEEDFAPEKLSVYPPGCFYRQKTPESVLRAFLSANGLGVPEKAAGKSARRGRRGKGRGHGQTD